MAAPLTTPLRTAEGYYKHAWRIAIRAQHPRWKEPIVKRNLAYLWASRSLAEEADCEALRAAASLMLPVIDLTIMPQRSVRIGWWPLRRGAAAAPVAPVVAPVPPPAAPVAPVPPQSVNTTSFNFWPLSGDLAAPIPNSKVGEENLFEAGTLLPASDPADGTWHGAATLGEGTDGHVYLFVKTNASNRIIDRMAIKDSKSAHFHHWTNPVRWRDQLPKGVAIQQRLAAQNHAGIVPFRGFRLNMSERRHRQYFDFCDYHSMDDTMVGYVGQHGTVSAKIQWSQYLKNPEMQNPPAIIPESFIWYFFRSLVDTLIVLRDGPNTQLYNGEAWRPIIHGDICLSNIFAAPALNADGSPNHPSYASTPTNPRGDKLMAVGRKHWPRILLADFDESFFSLQNAGDTYQDNPMHYNIGEMPDSTDPDKSSLENGAMSRYAPEQFDVFYTHSAAAPQPMGSATDVWALGQVLWCLLTNLIRGGDFRPRWEGEGHKILLNSGDPYTRQELEENLFRAPTAASRYSDLLKGVVRDCLQWGPVSRPGLEELRRRIMEGEELARGGDETLILRVPGDVERWVVGALWEGREEARGEGKGKERAE